MKQASQIIGAKFIQSHLHPQVVGDCEYVLIATAAEIHQHDAALANCARDLAYAGQRVGWLQRRDDTFKFAAELKSVQRLLVGRGDVLRSAHIMQPRMLGAYAGVVKPG